MDAPDVLAVSEVESLSVLQDLAEVSGGLGPAQTRRLIQEYRARQAF
mgnify:CR=1 FL=1